MNERRTWLLAIAGVVVAAVIGIIVATSGDDSDSTEAATQTPEPEATATAEPTATPEPEPTATPEPEPEPTATPEPEPTATPEPEPEPTATPEPEPEPEPVRSEIMESFVGATLAPGPGDVSVDGEVKVYWNNGSNGTLIAIYHGPGIADPTGMCPGNSIQTEAGFDHVTNTPAADGACDGFPTPTSAVRVCTGDVWLYETQIPNDSEGVLWGSLEMNSDGGIVGLNSQALNTPNTPVIEYSAENYNIAAMFTSDGSTQITGGPALP